MTETKEATPRTMFFSLLKIQKALKTVTKDKKAFKGAYATIEHVWESIRETINSNGFIVTHTSDASGITTIAMHESGGELKSFMPWSGNTDSQEQGKEITYAKRYGINAIFNVIVADEDTDATKTKGNYKKQEVDGSLAAKKLREAATHEVAKKIYKALSDEERKTSEVVDAIGFIKEKFALN